MALLETLKVPAYATEKLVGASALKNGFKVLLFGAARVRVHIDVYFHVYVHVHVHFRDHVYFHIHAT